MRQPFILVTVMLLLAFGCTAPVETPRQEADLEAERGSLLEADRALAEAHSTSDKPLDTFFASFADDGRVLAPATPIAVGWEASRAVFAELEAVPGYSLAWSPTTADVGRGADLGYTIGTYHMQLPDDDGNVVEIDGKYLSVWKRQPDGSWKIAVDMFNSDGPPVSVPE